MSKYGHRPHNWFEAIVNRLGGEEAAEQFLRGESVISKSTPSWKEQDGVIYFTVTSEGVVGPEWITYFEENSFFNLCDHSKSQLASRDFQATSGVTTQVVVLNRVLRRGLLSGDLEIHHKAKDKFRLIKPNTELACLICKKFTEQEIRAMGLTALIIAMSDGLTDHDRHYEGSSGRRSGHCGLHNWLNAYYGSFSEQWRRDDNFAYAVSPTCNISPTSLGKILRAAVMSGK